jgi:hypothetical protein
MKKNYLLRLSASEFITDSIAKVSYPFLGIQGVYCIPISFSPGKGLQSHVYELLGSEIFSGRTINSGYLIEDSGFTLENYDKYLHYSKFSFAIEKSLHTLSHEEIEKIYEEIDASKKSAHLIFEGINSGKSVFDFPEIQKYGILASLIFDSVLDCAIKYTNVFSGHEIVCKIDQNQRKRWSSFSFTYNSKENLLEIFSKYGLGRSVLAEMEEKFFLFLERLAKVDGLIDSWIKISAFWQMFYRTEMGLLDKTNLNQFFEEYKDNLEYLKAQHKSIFSLPSSDLRNEVVMSWDNTFSSNVIFFKLKNKTPYSLSENLVDFL